MMRLINILIANLFTCVLVSADQPANRLFRLQYSVDDESFCNASVCVDFDGDGKREILFASRKTKALQMLNASDGRMVWSKKLAGDQQSLSAHDLDGDGKFEILYSVSGPGRLYVLDRKGNVLRQWDAGDWKLGHSPIIADVDSDGVLDGLLGSRSKFLYRLNMATLKPLQRRDGWVQCGCYSSAMDVDGDGRWDFFAGSGDDSRAKGVLHRYDPVSLKTMWEYKTNDNASSADAVLEDIDGDGHVEIIKSVDNYAHDDAHDAVYAFETNGKLLWKTPGFSGEDSPNVADLDGDGHMEIIGMTFGGVVYCLDANGKVRWQRDLRPELSDKAHAYLAPVLCDVNGDRKLEIVALTNGGYFTAKDKSKAANGIVFALNAKGEVLSKLDLGGPRYWGEVFACNIDDDPWQEIVITGSGGLDAIETRGLGPATEVFQRRRNYQRLNVLSWAYEDSFFIYRGQREDIRLRADSLVLAKDKRQGRFVTEPLLLPPDCEFDQITFKTKTPSGTKLRVNLLDSSGKVVDRNLKSSTSLSFDKPARLEFVFETVNPEKSPLLDSYRLEFKKLPR